MTCNAIRPSAGTRLTLSDELKKAWEKAGKIDSIRRAEQSKPEDIGPLIVWLASDDAANVNGRTFYVETGKIALYSEPAEEKALVKVGGWTIDELFTFMPGTLAKDIVSLKSPTPQ